MDCRQGQIATSCRLAAVLLLAMLSGGCAVGVATSSGVATVWNAVFLIGVSSGASYEGSVPGLDPDRRVQEQDCRKPIEDSAANLKCR